MDVPFLIVLLCGVLTITVEAGVVVRHRRSPAGDKLANKMAFPHIVLVGLVDQPVPTAIGVPQNTPYASSPYGPPQPPSYPTSAYPPPSYGPPQPSYMAPMMPNQPPPMYAPPQTPYQTYQPPMYAPPQTPYQTYQPPMYAPPQAPYQTYQPPMYAPPQAPYQTYVPPQTPYPADQQPLATGPQQGQSLSEPKPDGLSNDVDQMPTKDFQMESTDFPSTDLSPEGTSEGKSSWETKTSS